MKILYIDNRAYAHNADIHVEFFSYMARRQYHDIYPYGKYLSKYFEKAITPGKNPNQELKLLVDKIKPHCIITYNCNGSSYEINMDNIGLYSWCEDFLISTQVPKFHFTTDYCRSGFRQEQGDWFKKLNYSAAFFRHKIALSHPIEVPAYWMPFSIDRKLYTQNNIDNVKEKEKKVGFIGAAHNSSKELYANRISAIDYLMKKDCLNITRILNEKKFERKILTGKDYVKFLSKNLFGLTCGGTCNFMTAKYFQIPAAYSMLVCTKTTGLDIFPENSYLVYDKNNLDEMYENITYYQKNLKEAKIKISTLHQYVVENHSHDQRIAEITKIIRAHL